MIIKAVSFFLMLGLMHTGHSQSLQCPKVRTSSGWLDLFPLPCKKNTECSSLMGNQHLCCKGFCTKGVLSAAPLRSIEAISNVVELFSPSTSTSATSSTTSTTTTPSTTTSTTTTTPSTTTSTTTTTPSTTTSTTTTTTTTTTTPSTTSSTTTTTTTPKPTTTSTEPPRPFLQILPIQTTPKTNAPAKKGKAQKYVCPKSIATVLFPIPCDNNSQCRATGGSDQVCCQGQCVKGVPAPRPTVKEQTHQPILGVIPRECPAAPLGELLFEVQSCKTDADCWPRVCCPDGARSYCRTARARLDLVPVANTIDGPIRMLESYLQCSPPPEFDSFPQRCSSSVDCFPNLCCAEGGNKHCRPPQRSFFSLLASAAQRFG